MNAAITRIVHAHSRARNRSRLVLLALADAAGPFGGAELTVAEIAERAHLSRRGVQTAIRDLCALGELLVFPGGAQGQPNRYWVMPPADRPRAHDPAADADQTCTPTEHAVRTPAQPCAPTESE